MARARVPPACRELQLLNTRAGAKKFVATYKRRVREAQRRGEQIISLAEYIDTLATVCRLQSSDPGGDVVL